MVMVVGASARRTPDSVKRAPQAAERGYHPRIEAWTGGFNLAKVCPHRAQASNRICRRPIGWRGCMKILGWEEEGVLACWGHIFIVEIQRPGSSEINPRPAMIRVRKTR